MNSQQKLVFITVAVLFAAFIVLSPGVVLNLPPHKNRFKTRNIFFTGETHISSVLVHALVFSVAAYFLITKYTLAPVISVVSNLSKPVKSITPTMNLLATTAQSN